MRLPTGPIAPARAEHPRRAVREPKHCLHLVHHGIGGLVGVMKVVTKDQRERASLWRDHDADRITDSRGDPEFLALEEIFGNCYSGVYHTEVARDTQRGGGTCVIGVEVFIV